MIVINSRCSVALYVSQTQTRTSMSTTLYLGQKTVNYPAHLSLQILFLKTEFCYKLRYFTVAVKVIGFSLRAFESHLTHVDEAPVSSNKTIQIPGFFTVDLYKQLMKI